jgi:thioredoxin 2
VTVRCGFCLTLNQVELTLATSRPTCGECERPILLDRPVRVAEEDFQATVREAGSPVLVDFYADWCGPCKMVAPLVDEIASGSVGRLLVVKVDTDRAPALSKALEIRGVPTVIGFRDGAEVGRVVGFDADAIRSLAEEMTP